MRSAIFFYLFVISISSFAQERTKKFTFGFGGGTNISLLSPKPSNCDQVFPLGFNAELLSRYSVSKRFFVEARLSFVKQFTKYSGKSFLDGDPTPLWTIKVTNDYASIVTPVSLNYVFAPNKPISFFVGLGLAPQRYLSAETKVVADRFAAPSISSKFTNDRVQDWNLNATAQTGIQFAINQGGKVLVSVSWRRSLFDLEKKTAPPAGSVYDYSLSYSAQKLNTFSFGVGYVY